MKAETEIRLLQEFQANRSNGVFQNQDSSSILERFRDFFTLRESGEGLNVKIDLEVVREICVELPKLSFATLTLTIATPVFSLEPKNYPKNGHFS